MSLCFADDYSRTATVVTFTGVAGARQHLALDLGQSAQRSAYRNRAQW
jgi:hypothetical protein